jgi:molybdate transport system ATP-binding protein
MDEVYKFCKNLLIVENGSSVIFEDTKQLFQNPQYSSVAKITGCKNISRCEVLNNNSIYAVDWDIILQTKNKVSPDIKYVGIHSHSFKICSKESFKTEKNIINLRILKIIEEMFEYSVLFENKNMKNSADNSTNPNNLTLTYRVIKELWNDIQNNDDIYLKIPEDLVLLLK